VTCGGDYFLQKLISAKQQLRRIYIWWGCAGIGLDVWMDFGVWLLMEDFTFPGNYGGM
jgi:hypothetical protein